jgi:hypothetical protein
MSIELRPLFFPFLPTVTVATFTNTNPSTPGSNYQATITWGDGATSSGTIAPSGSTETITGSHTYDRAGTFSVGVTLTDGNGAKSSTTSTATVTAAALTATGGFITTATAGVSATETLATFTDANPNDGASTYTATINWGDGSATSSGTVIGTTAAFTVSGTHPYASTGAYTATVTITDPDNTSATATSTINVGHVFTVQKSNVVIATFTTSDPNAQASNFTATINWGDGTGTDTTPTVSGTRPNFQVNGSHTYTVAGSYSVSVTITNKLGGQLTGSSTVIVKDALFVTTGQAIVGSPNVALNNVLLAGFTDPDSADTASKFTAKVNWGDGTALDTTPVILGATGLFQVKGTHTYITPGPYTIQVTIYTGTNPILPFFLNGGILNGGTMGQPLWFPFSLDSLTFLGEDEGISAGYRLSEDNNWGITRNGYQPVLFPEPEWQRNPAQQYPYAYVRESLLAVNAVFAQNFPQFRGNQILVKGNVWAGGQGVPVQDDRHNQIQFAPAVAPRAGNNEFYLTRDVATTWFPDKVNYYQNLIIRWFASTDNGNTWTPAGASSNLVYLLYDQPSHIEEPWLLQTFVDYGSRRATILGSLPAPFGGIPNAQTQPLPLFNAIWTNFSGRAAKRAVDQAPLQYYCSWNITVTSPLTTPLGAALLVWLEDGMCGAWQGLLVSAALSQGLLNDRLFPTLTAPGIVPNQPLVFWNGGFLINKWTFNGAGSNTQYFPGVFPYLNYAGPPMQAGVGDPFPLLGTQELPDWEGPPNQYVWVLNPGLPDVVYAQGTPGQNNNNPRASFANHGLVRLDTGPGVMYFDPSYGVTYSGVNQTAALLNFQKKAIAGFYVITAINQNIRAMSIRKPNNSQLELREN